MKKLVCDLCGKELDVRDCYDADGYSQYVNVEIRNSRKHHAEYDICNNCYEDILKYANLMTKEKGGNEDAKKHFKGKCPYTDKKCEDWRCQNCEIEAAERKYMDNDSEVQKDDYTKT